MHPFTPLRRRATLALAAAGLLAGATLPAPAETWPARPIKLVVPFAPGGGADTLARPLAESLRQRLGQPVVIENRTGAGSTLGTEFVAKAAPDGYTFLINTDAIAIYDKLYRNLRYDAFKDLAPVAYVASSPLLLAVNPGIPARTVKEWTALAQKDAAKLNFANSGPGSPHHLSFELLQRAANFQVGQANYRGGGPALNDVLAGHAQIGVFTYGAVRSFVEAGKLRPLAILSDKRSTLAPELPTVVESGYPSVHVALRFVVMAPARTPADIVSRMHAAIAESVAEPEFGKLLQQQGYEAFVTTPAATGQLLRDEQTRWGPLLQSLQLQLD